MVNRFTAVSVAPPDPPVCVPPSPSHGREGCAGVWTGSDEREPASHGFGPELWPAPALCQGLRGALPPGADVAILRNTSRVHGPFECASRQ